MSLIWSRISSWRSSAWFITSVVVYAVFVDQIFFAFILPVLPYSLPEYNGVAKDRVQYWTTIEIVVFGIACLVSCPLIGWWTDNHASRRWPFLAGLIMLLSSTLTMWLAHPIAVQIFSRVLQGMSDAVIYVVGMAIIIDTVSTKHVAEYMGYVTIGMNVGTFAGPLLGGAVFEAGGYHAMWAMMLGFVVLDTVLRLFMIERKPSTTADHSLPVTAVDLEAADCVSISGSTKSFIVVTEAEDTCQKRTAASTTNTFDLIWLLGSPRMITACLGTCIQSMVFSGFETVLSIYVQEIWDYNALGAGLIFIPLTVPAFFAPLIGRVVDRTSTRWALTAGFLSMCPIIALVQFVTYDSISQKVLLCFFLVMISLGITITLGPLMAEISHIAEEFVEKRMATRPAQKDRDHGAYAQAYALSAMSWSCGNIAGPLLCGLIKDHLGWSTMCIVLGMISGAVSIPCFVWSGRPRGSFTWPKFRNPTT